MGDIVCFKIKNFKSYKNEYSFSFKAISDNFLPNSFHTVQLKDGRCVQLLNSAVIYGANASGKSNIIWALYALHSFVKKTREFDPEDKLEHESFLFSSDTRHQATEFTLTFIAESKLYEYHIKFTSEKFESEVMRDMTDSQELFSRDEEGRTQFNKNYIDLADTTFLPNHLALSELALNANPLIQSLYKVFSNIQIIPNGASVRARRENDDIANEILKQDDSLISLRLKRLMKVADRCISDVKLKKNEESDFRFPDSIPLKIKQMIVRDNQWDIRVMHKDDQGAEIPLSIYDESLGTQKLFGLGARILDVLDKGGVLAYDEIDIALHPELFKLLIKMFHSPNSNPKGAQILFTTHDTSVLNDNVLRADQVWFAQKDANCESELFNATDFEGATIQMPFEAWYRSGRFGALPKFGNVDYIFEEA